MGLPHLPDDSDVSFVVSSYSGGGNCLEVARTPDGPAVVRDSKDRHGRPLVVDQSEWDAFLAGVRRRDV